MTPREEVFKLQIKLNRLKNSWWRFLPCNWTKAHAIKERIDQLTIEIADRESVTSEKFKHDFDEYINSIQKCTTKFRNHDI